MFMKTKIFFRVNALKNSGLGHLMRCLALAQILEKDFDCRFFVKVESTKYLDILLEKNFATVLVPLSLGNTAEAEWLCKEHLKGDEILILDGYNFLTAYQYIVKKAVGKLVCIDDIHQTHFVADVVINHSGGAMEEDYSCEANTKLFLGLDYLILRKPFWNIQRKKIPLPVLGQVLICMGGEDPNNDTLKLLEKCQLLSGVTSYKVVLGAGYKYREQLLDFCKEANIQVELLSNLSAVEMIHLMQECDSAICPPSTIALEYLCVGGNLFLHLIADNQQMNYDFLISQQLAFPFEEIANTGTTSLSRALGNQQQIMDGKSHERIHTLFTNLQKEVSCSFRPATLADVYLYFEWANDPEARLQSFSSESIPFLDHSNWFSEKIRSEKCKLYVLEYNGMPAGQIRFDLKNNIAMISYALDKDFRGKGLALLLVEGGMAKLRKEVPEVATFVGYVKPENLASKKIFQKLAFYMEEVSESKIMFWTCEDRSVVPHQPDAIHEMLYVRELL
jgi:UDP-2,4-diacetamido-2,4,6-trideoxy-beta-L-altropyranose hydrolase